MGSEPPAHGDDGRYAIMDEGYWQALLEQGEIAPEVHPMVDLDIDDYPQSFEPDLGLLTAEPFTAELEDEWHIAQGALDSGELFTLKVNGANRGGLLVQWNGLQGFVPASHLVEMPRQRDPRDRISELTDRIGDSLTVRLIEVNEVQNRLVFSERVAMPGRSSPAAILESLRTGAVCQGTVTSVTTFGAFVDLGGVEGLIHISELSWDRVRHPADVVHPGESVKAYVLDVKPDEQRVALSLKRARPDPWTQVGQQFRVGEVIEGTVTNVVSFGAFVRVAEGLEGLVHISELAEGNFLHPRSVVREGDAVQVRILNIDLEKHRLGLSIRRAHDTMAPAAG